MGFYEVCAGAAATLVGLLFVAVQIGPPIRTPGRVNPRHAMARSTFTVFSTIVIVSLLYIVPDTSVQFSAILTIAAAVIGVIRSVRTWIPVWRDKFAGRIEFRLWQTAWLLITPVIAFALLAWGAVRQLEIGRGAVLNVNTGFTFILLFVIGLRNSWNLLVEGSAEPER
jgi:hypothetical protein